MHSELLSSRFTGDHGSVKVLAKNSQSKRGDVPERAGGDSGRHRAIRVCQSPRAALQTVGQVCVQPTFPGNRTRTKTSHCEHDEPVY